LAAKDTVHEDDPRIVMTSAEFLAKAWKVANDKARAEEVLADMPQALGHFFTARSSG